MLKVGRNQVISYLRKNADLHIVILLNKFGWSFGRGADPGAGNLLTQYFSTKMSPNWDISLVKCSQINSIPIWAFYLLVTPDILFVQIY